MEEHCEQVAHRLVAEGAHVHCDDYWEAVIEDGDVKFKVSEYGIERIVTNRAVIDGIGSVKQGKIASFSVSAGGGYDAAKAGYALNDLSNPKPAHWDDDPEWVLSTIRAAISTDEMKRLVAKAENYQKLIKTELDTVK